MTTVTASVIPAARPAARRDLISALGLSIGADGLDEELRRNLSLLTQKSPLVCQSATTWIGPSSIGKHGLVALKTQKSYTHLRYDAGEDGSETFVESKRGLSSDSHGSVNQAPCFTLENGLVHDHCKFDLRAKSCT